MLMCENQAYSGYVDSLDDGEGEHSDSGYSHTLSSSDSDHWTTLSGLEGEHSDSGYSHTLSSSDSDHWTTLSGLEGEHSDSGYAHTLSSSDSDHWTTLSGLEGEHSDSGYSHTLSSTDSAHWATLSGLEGEDDVFTGREVVLSYDGCELSESGCNNQLDEDESPFQSEISISIDDSDVKNINISEINCTDSFLEWLDSEQDLGSPSTEYYPESDESTNETDTVDLHTLPPKSLPPIQTMIPVGSTIIHAFPMEKCYQARDAFNSLIRGSATSLHVDLTVDGVSESRGEYGHLLCKDVHNIENSYTSYYTSYQENQVVIQQSKGELLEKLRQRESASVQADKCLLECRWEDCWAVFVGQAALVRHIEKTHVELRRSDEFACLWQDCPRRTRPFNARYKLLIHMRVHSGEKPNKCPFPGCLKAFSRLENLKIHQRSHTGERPYCCQFPACAKAFSNSSDRAKHQRTHYDTKPYACQVAGCRKRYTDPSSLRKHIKNHAGATACKTKKLIASEPVVTISNMEQRQRERLNSYVSECTSDCQEEEYHLSRCGVGGPECEAPDCVGYEAADSFFENDSSRLTDFDALDNEIENHFFDDSHFDDSDFFTFADDEMLNLLCK